ncbi:MAG: DUF4091 domain-containing protein [Bacteroidales bacterium]|nr:DUF4091 domain-containing protein [Bacteroidales bacterium]
MKLFLKTIFTLALVMSISLPVSAKEWKAEKPDKCDPYMKAQGGYGYLIKNTSKAGVWWAEGCYKVMKDTPVAKRRGGTIKMSTARNEYESFILVVNPKQGLKDLKVTLSGLPEGIEATIRKTEYVNLFYNSDYFGFPGWWPDPLPLYESPADAPAGENTSFWVTLKTPKGFGAKAYSGRVTLSDASGWKVSAPVSVKVRNFELPDRPSCNADFGLWFNQVIQYENLNTAEQQHEAFDNYIKAFSDYKLQTRNPFYLNPIRYNVTPPEWTGGFYDSSTAAEGKYSFVVSDGSTGGNAEAVWTPRFIPVKSDARYRICVSAKSTEETTTQLIVDCFDADRKPLTFRRRFKHLDMTTGWQDFTMEIGRLDPRTAYIQVRLFAAGYLASGSDTATTWFDDVKVIDCASGENIFPQGNFEVDPDKIKVDVDFTEFNKAAEKYRNDERMRFFSLNIPFIGSVNFNNSWPGAIAGFRQGSPEYEKLMASCLTQLQQGLKEAGMLDKALLYWGDEPMPPAYPLLEDTHRMIKQYAPGITTFMTELVTWRERRYDTMDISGSTDISCVSWECFENHDVIKKYQQRPGQEPWNYLCATTQHPYFTDFIDADAIEMRIWLWASYMYGFKGVLMWSSTDWNSGSQYTGGKLQDPWEEPYCFATSDQLIQRLLAVGDGIFFYPHNRRPNEDKTTAYTDYPIPSLRLETLRDGIEDFEYLTMLEAKIPQMSASDTAKARKLLDQPPEVFMDDNLETTDVWFIHDPQYLFQRREQIAALLEKY